MARRIEIFIDRQPLTTNSVKNLKFTTTREVVNSDEELLESIRDALTLKNADTVEDLEVF